MQKIAELKAKNEITEVVGRYVHLTQKGAEHMGKCPFHDDHRASLNVNKKKQLYFCGACGAKGDMVDFLIAMGRTIKEAMNELEGISGAAVSGHVEQRAAKVSTRVEWTQVVPAPMPSQIRPHHNFGKPSQFWQYHNTAGELLGLICRFNMPDGKQVLPYTYCTDGQRKEWRYQGFAAPRPLYGLADLARRPDAPVLVVEGEKTADAAQALLPHVVVTCWQGGAEAVKKTDWSPLKGRNVVLWPDNDIEQRYGSSHAQAGQLRPWNEQPGNAAMLEIAGILAPDCKNVQWVMNSPDFPNKWDIADATDWTPDDAVQYVRANIVKKVPAAPWPELPQPKVAAVEPEPMPAAAEVVPQPVAPSPPPEYRQPSHAEDHETYFSFLGYQKEADGEALAFYVKEAKIVHKYGARSLSSTAVLVSLAPLDYWQLAFPKKSASRIDADAALNWLVRSSRAVGVFSPARMRGRGAWLDAGRVVIHSGETLIVNGQPVPLGSLKSRYIYEAGEDLEISHGEPLAADQAAKLLEICKLVNWERPVSAYLLAGWCVIAPICGALTWRPHLWITGPAGTGKTWVFQKIVRRMLGRTGLIVQGETSEAGVRQALGVDALPVLFDEAEGEDRRGADRIQSVLGLVRSASAEDGGNIVKGSAGGGVKNYRIRSCFAFASIALSLKQQSDRTRVTVLGIVKNPDDKQRVDRWAELQRVHTETVTDQFCDALQSRTLAIMPTILENTKTFSAAVAAHLQDQRTGDQLGPLIAGAYSLLRSGKVSFEDATTWVKKHDWAQERGLDESRDERRLLAFLLDHITRVDGNGMTVERSIGELIQIAAQRQDDLTVSQDGAQLRLKRLGLKVEKDQLIISNNSAQIARILTNTPWATNHNETLKRIEGASKTQAERFSGGLGTSRAVSIPLTSLIGEPPPNASAAPPPPPVVDPELPLWVNE